MRVQTRSGLELDRGRALGRQVEAFAVMFVASALGILVMLFLMVALNAALIACTPPGDTVAITRRALERNICEGIYPEANSEAEDMQRSACIHLVADRHGCLREDNSEAEDMQRIATGATGATWVVRVDSGASMGLFGSNRWSRRRETATNFDLEREK